MIVERTMIAPELKTINFLMYFNKQNRKHIRLELDQALCILLALEDNSIRNSIVLLKGITVEFEEKISIHGRTMRCSIKVTVVLDRNTDSARDIII